MSTQLNSKGVDSPPLHFLFIYKGTDQGTVTFEADEERIGVQA